MNRLKGRFKAGFSPDTARRQVSQIFGAVDQIKEECRQSRGIGLAESTLQDIRHSFRSLRRNARFAAAAILTLGLGIATTTVVFSVIDSALLNPVPFKNSDRIVRIYQWSRTGGGPVQTIGLFAQWREQHQIFEQVEAHWERTT